MFGTFHSCVQPTGSSACFMILCAGERLSTRTDGRAIASAPMAPSAASATWTTDVGWGGVGWGGWGGVGWGGRMGWGGVVEQGRHN